MGSFFGTVKELVVNKVTAASYYFNREFKLSEIKAYHRRYEKLGIFDISGLEI